MLLIMFALRQDAAEGGGIDLHPGRAGMLQPCQGAWRQGLQLIYVVFAQAQDLAALQVAMTQLVQYLGQHGLVENDERDVHGVSLRSVQRGCGQLDQAASQADQAKQLEHLRIWQAFQADVFGRLAGQRQLVDTKQGLAEQGGR
ncbi:hypothetical protein D3C80_1663440 [compost metagenome]